MVHQLNREPPSPEACHKAEQERGGTHRPHHPQDPPSCHHNRYVVTRHSHASDEPRTKKKTTLKTCKSKPTTMEHTIHKLGVVGMRSTTKTKAPADCHPDHIE
ncbi:hypothetical protein GOP47_0003413 [Adiantum capillus-veneris]|uniref:Uncharacterized protein n=1 Tax=Adiantum capillus-veneris TaxID=13818 RepID=A0A9D4VBX4_ADICA|nr:hypothetical protein GOP47_0003413 [Adiantum capillus-veneris]